MKNVLIIILLFISTEAFSLCSSNKYELSRIDSVSINEYYILYFLDYGKMIKVFSSKKLSERDGCWEFLIVGKRYEITLLELSFIIYNGISYRLRPEGLLLTDGKVIIEPGEIVYKAGEINGLLIKL